MDRFTLRARQTAGFTLIELVVVIAILGIFGAIALPRFMTLRDPAEKASLDAWIGGLRSAYTLAHANQLLGGGAYTAPHQMSLFNLVRCDNLDQLPDRASSAQWQGHYMALGGLRPTLFADPDEMVCNGNTIRFTAKSGRLVTITNSAAGLTWTAAPPY